MSRRGSRGWSRPGNSRCCKRSASTSTPTRWTTPSPTTTKGDLDGVARAKEQLTSIDDAIAGVELRAANIKVGHVYVISNIGAFGPDVVKIGMTRRSEPLDRVRQLGDASVPFRFDVHALVFSEDAMSLETELHRRLSHKCVNLVNMGREFFYATPAEVKEHLIAIRDAHVLQYTDTPKAVEWRVRTESPRHRRRGRRGARALGHGAARRRRSFRRRR